MSEIGSKQWSKYTHLSQFRTICLISDHVLATDTLLENNRCSVCDISVHTEVALMFSYLCYVLGMQDEFSAGGAEVIKAVRIHSKAKNWFPISLLELLSVVQSTSGESAARALTSNTCKTSLRCSNSRFLVKCLSVPINLQTAPQMKCFAALSGVFFIHFSQRGSVACPWDTKSYKRRGRLKAQWKKQ